LRKKTKPRQDRILPGFFIASRRGFFRQGSEALAPEVITTGCRERLQDLRMRRFVGQAEFDWQQLASEVFFQNVGFFPGVADARAKARASCKSVPDSR